jgi:hypothetical protein
MVAERRPYTSQLGAGLGLITETKALLDLWEPGTPPSALVQMALDSGHFPTVTARRLRNIVHECFAPRYLTSGDLPAAHLKRLAGALPTTELAQLLLLFTSRANPILGDFIRQVYWERYTSGYTQLTNSDARAFVERAIDKGLTTKRWADSMIQNVAGYLTGCCADYGMLERGRRVSRRFQPFRITSAVAAYVAYDLHFAGVSDNALLTHADWHLFGLAREDVLEELKRLSLRGLLIVQAAGEVVRISWTLPNQEALCDVLAQG